MPPPPSPTTVSAVPVNRSGVIRVSWTAPTMPDRERPITEELPITGYSIRYHIRGSGVSGYQYMNASQSPAEVTGLLPGTEYRVYVASVNAIGTEGYCCGTTLVIVRTHNGRLNNVSESQHFVTDHFFLECHTGAFSLLLHCGSPISSDRCDCVKASEIKETSSNGDLDHSPK